MNGLVTAKWRDRAARAFIIGVGAWGFADLLDRGLTAAGLRKGARDESESA